jgi:myo-inositol-1(or 4)-monophosphatase
LSKGRAELQGLLAEATERVQLLVAAIALSEDRGKFLGVGASGDRTLVADKIAEDELVRALLSLGDMKILSEEAGERGDPRANSLAIIDPLDGSSNFMRGIPFYCTSVAVVEGGSLKNASFGMVRNLVNGDVYSAERGKGARKNGKRIRTSVETKAAKAVVDIDLSRSKPEMVGDLSNLISAAKRQVHFGANALELCLLAEGRIDSFVDLRGKMRVTDFAAAYLIAKEAGAVVTDGNGKALDPELSLEARFSYVASANKKLQKEVLGLCAGGSR